MLFIYPMVLVCNRNQTGTRSTPAFEVQINLISAVEGSWGQFWGSIAVWREKRAFAFNQPGAISGGIPPSLPLSSEIFFQILVCMCVTLWEHACQNRWFHNFSLPLHAQHCFWASTHVQYLIIKWAENTPNLHFSCCLSCRFVWGFYSSLQLTVIAEFCIQVVLIWSFLGFIPMWRAGRGSCVLSVWCWLGAQLCPWRCPWPAVVPRLRANIAAGTLISAAFKPRAPQPWHRTSGGIAVVYKHMYIHIWDANFFKSDLAAYSFKKTHWILQTCPLTL